MTERRYLKNITPKTLAWYRDTFNAFSDALESESDIKQRIVALRTRGVSPMSVNSWLRCINAYFRWKGLNLKIPRMQEEQKILAGKDELPLSECLAQSVNELGSKNGAQHLHRQEEGVLRVNPAFLVRGKSAGRDHTVYMRMKE